MLFKPGQELVVITQGPGHLCLLSYGSKDGSGINIVGAMNTNAPGITRWLISFSHRYDKFAFIWDGQGEGVYQIGNGLERRHVGRKWTAASTAHKGASHVGIEDVADIAKHAINRDGATTVYAIPNNI